MLLKGRWRKIIKDYIPFEAGNKRQDRAERVDAANGRAPVAPELRRIGHINGARAEYATWLLLPPDTEWVSYRESGFSNIAEVAGFIDAKATWRYPIEQSRMYVKRDTRDEGDMLNIHPEWAYVSGCGFHHPWWWIAGWLWGREVMTFPVVCEPKHCYMVELGALRPITELIEIVRLRALKKGS